MTNNFSVYIVLKYLKKKLMYEKEFDI